MPTYGFAGSVDDRQFARMGLVRGPRWVVQGPTDFLPTVTGADRTVSIAAGSGWLGGVRYETTGATVKQAATNVSGSTRYDMIVARGNWATDTVSFEIVQGTPGAPIPTAITKSLLTTGDVYEGPVCVMRTANGQGAYAGGDLFDVRPWGGVGGLVVPQGSFLTAHDLVPGYRWSVDATSTEFVVNNAGALQLAGVKRFSEATQTGSGSLTAATTATIATVTINDPGAAYRIEAWGKLGITTPAVGVTGSIQVTYDSTTWDTNRIGSTAVGLGSNLAADTVIDLPEQRSVSLTGSRTVRLLCRAGANNITVGSGTNYSYGVRVVPSIL